jgi:hypothetical protein
MAILTDKTVIETFAGKLVELVANRYPPQVDADPSKQPSEARLTRILEDMCERAIAFRDEQRLGWLGKARLGNAVRWQLTEKGYRKQFVELATEALVVKISQRKR